MQRPATRHVSVALVEDDPADAAALTRYLEAYQSSKPLEFRCRHFESATRFLADPAYDRQAFDLIFLDIEMPGINGMDAARQLRSAGYGCPLLFVTNMAQFALHGYEVDACAFLVKPVDYAAFCTRLDRALKLLDRQETRRIALKTLDGLTWIDLSQLLYLRGSGHYVDYRMSQILEPLRCRTSFTLACQALHDEPLVTISNALAVSMDHIVQVNPTNVRLDNGETLPLSRSRRQKASQRICTYLAEGIF